MKILLIHQAFVSPGEPGGTRHYELAQHMVQKGHEFVIVASDLSYLSGQHVVNHNTKSADEEKLNGLRVLRAYTYPSLHRGLIGRVISLLSFMVTSFLSAFKVGRADVFMGTSPPIFQTLSTWLVAFLRRSMFVLEVRDLWPEFLISIDVLKNPLIIWCFRRLESFLYARARHIIVNSPAYRDYLIKDKHVAPAKVTLIPNGTATEQFDPNDTGDELREKLDLADKFIVTYTGALSTAYDIYTLLRAADRLRDAPDIHFLLVGDGRERPNLEKDAKARSLPNVTFTGAYPKTEIPHILAASDAGVAILKDIPAFRTTYPNKVFDYMAAGLPVVLAIDGVIREAVDAADAGVFVPPGDDEALAAAIVALKQDRARGHEMGAAGRAYVIEHFDRKQQAEQFAALLQQLVESRVKTT